MTFGETEPSQIFGGGTVPFVAPGNQVIPKPFLPSRSRHTPGMSKRRWLLLGLAFMAIAICIVFFVTSDREPTYAGRSLSDGEHRPNASHRQAITACPTRIASGPSRLPRKGWRLSPGTTGRRNRIVGRRLGKCVPGRHCR